MNTWQIFASGWRQMRQRGRWRMVALFFGAYLAVAAALAAPMYSVLERSTARNGFAAEMLRGFDSIWAADFGFWNAAFLESFGQAVAWAAIGFALAQAILMAGALQVFQAEFRTGDDARAAGWLSDFGRGCGRHFAVFLRLLLLGGLLYGLAFWLLNSLVARLLERATSNVLPEWPLVVLTWVRVGVLLAVLFVINLVLDYARARIVAEDRAGAVFAFSSAVSFVRSNFGRVAGAYVLWGAAGLALVAAYLALAWLIPQGNLAAIALWFLLAQAFLFLRLWLRLGFYASAMSFVNQSPSEPPA